ncbi:MAG: site-specific DNA-methyltransferase [Verrucomicrobia bacterium]|nr:site-specific DNA-methyltransferase [Verrucomicrobiota bacterium]
MATGIPNSNGSNGRANSRASEPGIVKLSYPGKRLASEILATRPAQLSIAWEGDSARNGNALYYGENLAVLAALLREPRVRGKVRLIYIDPPYATRSVFQSRKQADAYHDLLGGPDYLEFLRERLILLRELLADDGSIYVHLDENMAFQAKVLMDEVFGPSNFRNWLTRKKCNPKNYTRKTYGNVADYILFYTKTDNYVWHRPVEAWTDERAAREYTYAEAGTGRRFKKVPVHAPGVRNGETGKTWRGVNPPPGKHWQYPPRTLDEMDARGEIYWSPTGNPRRKIYLDQSVGIPVQDIWMGFRDAHNQNIRITGYPTEKNPALLARIIAASSDPGDLVLDCFCGSGTTLEAAHRLSRHWLGVDQSPEAIRTTLARFAKGVEPMGDFVRRMERDDAKQSDEEMLPLLDLESPSSKPSQAIEAHEPITDFTFHVAADVRSADIMKGWPPCNSTAGSLLAADESNLDTAVLREEPTSSPTMAVKPRHSVSYLAKKRRASSASDGKPPLAQTKRKNSRRAKRGHIG